MIKLNADNISYRKVEDEYFILTIPDAVMHNIAGSGVFIFDKIIEGLDEETILKSLTEEYEVTRGQADEDLKEFLGQLDDLGIIER